MQVEQKKIWIFLVSAIMVIQLLVTACTAPIIPTTTITTTPQIEKTQKILNPQGIPQPVEIKPLAPRLSTLNGKTIYVVQGEVNPVIMPALWERLNKDYPKTNWRQKVSDGFGPDIPEEEVLKNAQTIICGNAW
jgi:hypothetical protein